MRDAQDKTMLTDEAIPINLHPFIKILLGRECETKRPVSEHAPEAAEKRNFART